ncbi:MAG TPA: nitroreductase family protein, partial [Chloroflexota bacterium]
MTETASVLEAIGTTRSLRRFRPDPIPDELLRELLAAATCAPSGGNSQSWRFLVVRDPELRRRVGALYKEGWDEYSPPSRLAAISDPRERRRVESAYHLGAHMGDEAPVLLLFCAPRQQRAGAAASFAARTAGASIYPAVQNLLLAARARGIGGCLTTIHLYREPQVKAVLGIPEEVDTYALVPLGYPRDNFGPVR